MLIDLKCSLETEIKIGQFVSQIFSKHLSILRPYRDQMLALSHRFSIDLKVYSGIV